MKFPLASVCVALTLFSAASICAAEIQPPAMVPGGWKQFSVDMRGRDREASVLISFTVKADGSLEDINVVDGFYNEAYALMVIRGAKSKKLLPAKVDGVPVDFHGAQMLIRINLPGVAPTGPGFGQRYQAAAALVKAGQVEDGARAIEDMIANHVSSNYEFAFLNAALVPIYGQLGRNHDALRASVLATLRDGLQEIHSPAASFGDAKAGPGWRYSLSREVVPTLLRQQFVLAAALQDNHTALSAYRQLLAVSKVADDDPVAIRARTLQQRVLSLEPFSASALIRDGSWTYRPVRRVLAVTDVQGGTLKSLHLQCSFHQQDYSFSADAEWVLQPSWGDCAVTFKGDDGTRFAVHESVAPSP